jgi:uncharacterized iron-regulated membrane protein
MKLQLLTRRLHYWGAIVFALPGLVMITTGLLLQVKKNWSWVQPTERRGQSQEVATTFSQLLQACRQVPEAEIRSWSDVQRIDVRPSRGLVKVTAKNNWEIQLDAGTAEILQVAYRRSDIIESLHDGSWFHPLAKLWVFFPAGVLLLFLLISGMYLFWLPRYVRWRRSK